MGNWYEEKQDARRERYLDRADKADQEKENYWKRTDDIARFIPPGQPILIGHHSEKRHRRDLERMDNLTRKAIDAKEKADHYRRKADAVGLGGISSDDPDAVEKLRDQLDALEEKQRFMKQVNAAWKKAGSPAADNTDAWRAIADALGVDMADLERTRESLARGFINRPFPGYELTNNGANIRRIRERIEELENRTAAAPDIEGAGYRIVENADMNRIQFFFDDKPTPEIRAILKRSGWRWAPSVGAWQRHLNNNGRYSAGYVEEKIKEFL
ncbi:MAG: DUF3560 domain-containing protein [Deltaproteobacteria bacterium]|nr:DUF3560 domain-containing protein [Candidatus Zymogenaceae bacterium]